MSQRGVLKTFLVWGIPLALTVVLVIAGAMKVQEFVSTSPRFYVQSIEVLSEGPADKDELIKAANIPTNTNLFSLDLAVIKERIEKNPWVASANITRALPDRLLIRYVPQVPVAILNVQGMHYINARGKVFTGVRPGDSLQYPLVQMENPPANVEKINPEQIRPALEALELLEKSTILTQEDVSEISLRGPEDHGGVVLALTAKYPTKALRSKVNKNSHLMTLHFGDEDLRPQFRRAEAVLHKMTQSSVFPRLVRLELGKKVVVKIDQ